MKVQYQLVDAETKRILAPVGGEFEIMDSLKDCLDGEELMSWDEAYILFGDPMPIKNPVGILNNKRQQ